MNKFVKRLLVCGASLVMVASLSSGISNVSARRIHYSHPRTQRIAKNSHILYKLGYKDGNHFAEDGGETDAANFPLNGYRAFNKCKKMIINHIIATHFSHAYEKGFKANPSIAQGPDQGALDTLISKAKRIQRHSHRYAKRHYRRPARHVHKPTKRIRNKKHHVTRRHSTKRTSKNNHKRNVR